MTPSYFSPDISDFLCLLRDHEVRYLVVGGEMADGRALAESGAIFQFGMPPNRIDPLNRIDGVTFEESWTNRREVLVPAADGEVRVWYIGLADLIRNKTAAGRGKDLEDLRFLRRLQR